MTKEEAITILLEQKKVWEHNLFVLPSAEYVGNAAKGIYENKIKALEIAIESLEKEEKS